MADHANKKRKVSFGALLALFPNLAEKKRPALVEAKSDDERRSLFDEEWYLATYPDIRGMDAFDHFVWHGEAEGRDPSATFSTPLYRRTYMAGEAIDSSPTRHFLRTGRGLGYDPSPPPIDEYAHRLYAQEQSFGLEIPELLRHIEVMTIRPRFLLLVDGDDKTAREALEASLQIQLYGDWAICTRGDVLRPTREPNDDPWFLIWLRPGDGLHSCALYCFASAINADPTVDVVYGDEDELTTAGRRANPFYKPGWTPDDHEACNYIGSGACVCSSIAGAVLAQSRDADDFLLLATERARHVKHVRRVLVHRSRGLSSDLRSPPKPGPHPGTRAAPPPGRTTLVYLARGAEDDCRARFDRFVRAYTTYPAGMIHDLVIVFKGFPTDEALNTCKDAFVSLSYHEILTDDLSFDIGAYAVTAEQIETDRICFLNTNSEPAAPGWLLKLAMNLEQPGIGLVGATGSFQTHLTSYPRFPPFPNLHLRTNAFMMRSAHARKILPSFKIYDKWDAYLAECGPEGVTRQIMALGFGVLLVGRNGRGYAPQWWSSCEAYHQGDQANLLVRDNQTRLFEGKAQCEKQDFFQATWGNRDAPGRLFAAATP